MATITGQQNEKTFPIQRWLGAVHLRLGVCMMPYRRVSCLEQCWYLIKYKIRHLLRREERRK